LSYGLQLLWRWLPDCEAPDRDVQLALTALGRRPQGFFDGYLIKLNNCHLAGVNLYGANLRNASLSAANMDYAILSCSDLRDASLFGANLRGALLGGAKLEGAWLAGADLREVKGLTLDQLANARINQRTKLPAPFRLDFCTFWCESGGKTAGTVTGCPPSYGVPC
jgi:hypothetical protein